MTDAAETPPAAAGEPKTIDLDAARKARREQRGEAPTIKFFGEHYVLPHSLPADVIDLVGAVGAGDFTATTQAMRLLCGGEAYDRIREKAIAEGDPLELDDVVFLLEQALELYEVTLPESEASPPPS